MLYINCISTVFFSFIVFRNYWVHTFRAFIATDFLHLFDFEMLPRYPVFQVLMSFSFHAMMREVTMFRKYVACTF